MADAYIDYDETRIYGEYAIEQIAHHLAGRLREFDAALHLAVSALRAATDSVAQQLHQARAADPELHEATEAREAPLAEAREVIVRFARHLESHRPGTVPYGAFFVEPATTLSQRGPQRLLAALDHVLGSLDELGASVREQGHWRDEIARARHGLDAVLVSDQRIRARQVRGAGLEAARQHWLRVYEATKHLVAAALGLSGSTVPMDEIFDDLADVHRADGARDDEPSGEVA
jgi:hypothetical protein